MPFVVGLAYNLKKDCPRTGNDPEDIAAEYEEQSTVNRIARALRAKGHRVVRLPYGADIPSRLKRSHVDIVFNIAEGWDGRNREAHVPAILEICGVPYTGSDPLTLSLALDKSLAKMVMKARGIPTPKFAVVRNEHDFPKINLKFPIFIKPAYEGSSKGIRDSCKVDDQDQLLQQVNWALNTYHQPVLLEEFLPGREFTVGILGNDELQVFPVMEIRPKKDISPEGFVYSFETKSQNLEQFLCPAPIPKALERKIKNIAVRAFRALECRDMARVDVRLDGNDNPFFLEINPLPGLSSVSLFPLTARAAGLSFEELIDKILMLAAARTNIRMREEAIL
ncbi:MAG TPA: ATP-grasp domain-containing protein [Firmicutes bacterium]|nr:ATP-grasp domain-containing protein [Bacillota bacterium]